MEYFSRTAEKMKKYFTRIGETICYSIPHSVFVEN